MTNLDGTYTELCGCVLNEDGRRITPCHDCLKAALSERTHGITPPTLWERLTAWFR